MSEPAGEVWVLGATGRTGLGIARRLAGLAVAPVLVGRREDGLREAARAVGGEPRTRLAPTLGDVTELIARERPSVVVNTVGPFPRTMPTVVGAGAPGTHYVDVANELSAALALLDRHDDAVRAGRTLVTGAGFGVYATESVVLDVCADRPPPARVRVDALASVDVEAGRVGTALASTLVDGLATGGRVYDRGRLVRSRLGGHLERVLLPDGTSVPAASAASAELEAARRASGAPSAVAASALVPTGRVARAGLPLATALLQVRPLRDAVTRRLAGVRFDARERPREHSWAHARVEWPSGEIREGWLRAGEAMEFTSSVAAEVAARLARGEGRPGAYTPGALFGAGLATAVGAGFVTR